MIQLKKIYKGGIAMLKTLNVKLLPEEHREIKMLAASKGLSIKDYLLSLVKKDLYDNEPLTDEDLKDIEQSEKDIKEGNTITLKEYLT